MDELLTDPVARSILLVLAFGALAYLCSRLSAMIGRVLALGAGVWVLVFGILVAAAGDVPTDYDPLLTLNLAAGVSLSVRFAATHLGALAVIAAGAFTVLIALYACRYMAGRYWEGKFYAYLIWALAGACLVGWAGNFFVLLLGWELVTLVLFLMFNHGRAGSEKGAAKTYGILGFADACLLLAVGLMFALQVRLAPGQQLHGLALTAGGERLALGPAVGPLGYVIYALLLVAALAKAGAIPLHSWIPAAAADAPTPVMAYLPAAVDKLLGIYLLARVVLDVFYPDWTFQVILMIVGAVTILAAVFMAMLQHNLKKLLGFHAVSQVGYMVLGIATGTPAGVVGGLFHMLNNAIYKSTLFLMSGTVGREAGTDEIEDMGGLARRLPVTFVCGAIAAAAISGVPPFNGFVSKWLIYQGTLNLRSHALGTAMLVAAVFGSALTLASFVKVLYSAFLSRAPADRPVRPGRGESFWMAAPMVVLAAACVGLGLYPRPILTGVFVPAAENGVPAVADALVASGGVLSVGALGTWGPPVATGLILIGLGGGLALLGVFALKKVRVVRPFIAGEVFIDDDRVRTPGTGFYETIARLPALGPLLAHGQRGAMDLYRWFGRYGGGVVQVLRGQHTGLISLYVAWCVVGLAVTLVYLLITGSATP